MDSFNDYLVDNEINKRNLNLLIKEFKKEVFIPFIGAGCSLPLGEPDWENLFKKLRMKYKLRVKLSRDKDGLVNFPRLFSKIYSRLPNNNNFYKDIFEILRPTVTTGTFLHIYLIRAFDSYLTTNYDTPIEEAYYLHKKVRLKKYYLFCPMPDINFKNCIVYLHGHRDINFAIIKEEDYKYFYPSISGMPGAPLLESFLEYILQKKKIIFIGSSFSDKYLVSFLKLKNRINKHFLLIDNSTDRYQAYIKVVEEYKSKNELEKAKEQENKFYSSFG